MTSAKMAMTGTSPAIAMHGGWVELVGVEGSTVLLRLGGGCLGRKSGEYIGADRTPDLRTSGFDHLVIKIETGVACLTGDNHGTPR